MKWNSPWGQGCPGWHIECSVLGRKFLGDKFDIHGGGIDNLFPHHECECAQGDILTGDVPMNYFLHNNLVTVNGTKMGKSLGNSMTLTDLFARYGAQVIRYFVVQFHYRSMIDFSDEAIQLAKKNLDKITEFVLSVRKIASTEASPTGQLKEILNNCEEAMNDDFNTPVLIAEILKLVKVGAPAVKLGDKQKCEEINYIISHMIEGVLGLKFEAQMATEEEMIAPEIEALAKARWQAKKDRDFAKADALRGEIAAKGYEVIDTKDGYELNKI